MTEFITPDDLLAHTDIDRGKAEDLIKDALALARLAAPCLKVSEFAEDPDRVAAVRAVLRGAIIRKNEAGSGAHSQAGVGPFQLSADTRPQQSRTFFWPSEIAQLREICDQFSNADKDLAFSVDTASGRGASQHRPWCALAFNADYCSCGADIAGFPLWEAGTP